jgi:hypothetical protein
MLPRHDSSSSISREQVTEAYLKAIGLIDERVTPYLGKATTRALVQGAAKRITTMYPFLACLIHRPYTDVVPVILQEYLSNVAPTELAHGLHTLLNECFSGLRELTGDLIAPTLHEEVQHQLQQFL